MSDDVLYEKRDNGVALITLNRPDSLNAMGGDVMALLPKFLRDARYDRAVRAVILTGAGRAFCAGGDVKGMAAAGAARSSGNGAPQSSIISSLDAGVEDLRQSQWETSGMLHTMPKPTVAMVNGHAVGAGLSLALACDIRIASEKAKFGTVFRNVGFSGDYGGSYYLTNIVGTAKARELYFTGRIMDADEALAIGLAMKVVPHDRLEEETMAFADELASGPTRAFARMKENLNLATHTDIKTLMDQEALNMRLSAMTNDHRDAAKAFVEKRQPKFAGI